uniref:Mediator of RNA polymerase II transcription subunit 8 n=1 Tax=Panagrellus redivivus TaxID=6233 RepID=A0A7E4ZV95_PANRE
MNPQEPPAIQMVPIRQSHPELLKTSIDAIQTKLLILKRGIEELLFSLDANDKVSWPAFMAKCSSLAADLSSIQTALRKSMVTNGNEDNGEFLKSQLLLPYTISPEVNPKLLELTEQRVPCWNHETAPAFLRTKLDPRVEDDYLQLEAEANQYQNAVKKRFDQVSLMNKHLESVVQAVNEQMTRLNRNADGTKMTYNNQQTETLIRTVYTGEGLNSGGRKR